MSVACGQGDSSVAHWTRFCVVPLFVALYFTRECDSFDNLAQIAASGSDSLIVASVVIHQFLRLLIERCGMLHHADGRNGAQWSLTNWINTLGQQFQLALPNYVVKRSWPSYLHPLSGSTNACSMHSDGIQIVDSDSLRIMSFTRADKLAVSCCSSSRGTILGVLPAGHCILKMLHAQKSPASPNVTIYPSNCDCSTPHFQIECTEAVALNDVLNIGDIGTTNGYPYILGQFDGGCHSNLAIGGAGYCIYLTYPEAIKLIKWNSISLPVCSDNIVAEVAACRFLVQDIVDLCRQQLQHMRLMERSVYIQGDILPVIKNLSFAGRLRREDLLPDLGYILSLSSRWLPFIKWRALPLGQSCHLLNLYSVVLNLVIFHSFRIALVLPFVSAQLLIGLSSSVSGAQSYLSRVVSNGGAVLVDYSPRSDDSLGRRYCVQVGAQRLSRAFRFALFGQNHGEIDLNGAFYEIVRRFHLQISAPHPQLMSIHELRHHLQVQYDEWPNASSHCVVKRLPLRVMNSTLASSLRWIESIGLPPPTQIIYDTLSLLETHAHNLVQALSPQVRPLLDLQSKDAPFRILQVVENAIMQHFVSALTVRGLLQSVIWLHDGIWCYPIPPTDTVLCCVVRKKLLLALDSSLEGNF